MYLDLQKWLVKRAMILLTQWFECAEIFAFCVKEAKVCLKKRLKNLMFAFTIGYILGLTIKNIWSSELFSF